MLPFDSVIYKELVSLLKNCTGGVLPVYNATMITRPPKDKERIEFRLMNFFSTGQIYETKNLEGAGYKVGTV
ncbi:MAG: hypothetical protein ACRCX2_04990, partial [Paraclostridium sp.]